MENTSTKRKLTTASLLPKTSDFLAKKSKFVASQCKSHKSCAPENKSAISKNSSVGAKPFKQGYDATDTRNYNLDSDESRSDAAINVLISEDAADENKSNGDPKNDFISISITTKSRTDSAVDKPRNDLSLILDDPKADISLKTEHTTRNKLQIVASNSKDLASDVIVDEFETDVKSNTSAAASTQLKANNEKDARTIIHSGPCQSTLQTSREFYR